MRASQHLARDMLLNHKGRLASPAIAERGRAFFEMRQWMERVIIFYVSYQGESSVVSLLGRGASLPLL